MFSLCTGDHCNYAVNNGRQVLKGTNWLKTIAQVRTYLAQKSTREVILDF